MNRDLVVNIILIIAGIVLALALFGAGAVWRGRMSAEPAKSSVGLAPGNVGLRKAVNCFAHQRITESSAFAEEKFAMEEELAGIASPLAVLFTCHPEMISPAVGPGGRFSRALISEIETSQFGPGVQAPVLITRAAGGVD